MGCFWERQYAMTMVEMDPNGPFKRNNSTVTTVVGYAGSHGSGQNNLVCYDTGDSTDYGDLGYCEAERVALDHGKEAAQFEALVADYFGAFIPGQGSFNRPDTPGGLGPGDVGSPYRSVVGIPGGVKGPLYSILSAGNLRLQAKYNMTMNLKPAINSTADEVNTVWVYDSTMAPFHLGEQYHQYHSNFFENPQQPAQYPSWYLNDLWKLQISLGNIPKTGCDEGVCPPGPDGSCHW